MAPRSDVWLDGSAGRETAHARRPRSCARIPLVYRRRVYTPTMTTTNSAATIAHKVPAMFEVLDLWRVVYRNRWFMTQRCKILPRFKLSAGLGGDGRNHHAHSGRQLITDPTSLQGSRPFVITDKPYNFSDRHWDDYDLFG